MIRLSNLKRLNLSEKIVILFSIFLIANLTRLLLTRKITHLFVDDWSIFKDFSAAGNGINLTNLAPYNGHSLFVIRILYIFTTKTMGIQISTFSIILAISLLVTIFFLARSTSRAVVPNNNNFACAIVVIVCLNLNQYQNLTMPICWSWTICLIALIWTHILTNQEINVFRGVLLAILSFIGPLTLSFGFIIPGYVILKLAFEIFQNRHRCRNFILLTCITLFTIFAYKVSILNSASEYGSFTNPIRMLNDPINAVIFLLTSIGSPFTPASRFSVTIASVFGLITFFLLLRILLTTKSFSAFLSKDGLITLGIFFHVIHLLGRYDGSWTSILIAAQPRYSTGAILLVLGIFLNLIRNGAKSNQFLLTILLGIMTLSGTKTAEDFSLVRHNKSVEIAKCISNHSLDSRKCELLLDPGESILSQAKFKKALVYLKDVS
jgi:hypothetical protein